MEEQSDLIETLHSQLSPAGEGAAGDATMHQEINAAECRDGASDTPADRGTSPAHEAPDVRSSVQVFELRLRIAELEGELDLAHKQRDQAAADLHAAQIAVEALADEVAAVDASRADAEVVDSAQEQTGTDAGLQSYFTTHRSENDPRMPAARPARLAGTNAEPWSLEAESPASHGAPTVKETEDESLPAASLDPQRQAEGERQPASVAHQRDEGVHLVFFVAAGRGYALIEQEGSAPEVGDLLDLSAHGGPTLASVARVARAPLPGSPLTCAYLI